VIRFKLCSHILHLSVLLIARSQSAGVSAVDDDDVDVVALRVDYDRSIVFVEKCDVAEQQKGGSAAMFDV
jgi:hypothetical protein